MAAKYTFATVTLIGETFQRRQMIVLSLLKAGRGKPNIWIEAGIHAREWISPAMAIYIIDQLLNNDQDGILSQLNFHILPIHNGHICVRIMQLREFRIFNAFLTTVL